MVVEALAGDDLVEPPMRTDIMEEIGSLLPVERPARTSR
jgi:hypothetical protein